MGFSVMLWGAEKLVPAEYWCPYGIYIKWIEMEIEPLCFNFEHNLKVEMNNN